MSNETNGVKITIQSGGISQAICKELNISDENIKKINGSVWLDIFKEVEKQNEQGKIYDGGSNLFGSAKENFKVYTGQVIEFSKTIWNNIIGIINKALKTDIPTLDSENSKKAESSAGSQTQTAESSKSKESITTQNKNDITYEDIKITVCNQDRADEANITGSALNSYLESPFLHTSNITKILESLSRETDFKYLGQVLAAVGSDLAQKLDSSNAFSKNVFWSYILTPLLEKAKEYGLEDMPKITSNSTPEDMDRVALELTNKLNNYEKECIEDNFEYANQTLLDAANMDSKPQYEELEDGNRVVTLDDGSWIKVVYDFNGNITDIYISYDATEENINNRNQDLAEVHYSANEARSNHFSDDKPWDYTLSPENYNFEKLKQLAEQIFSIDE